MKRTPIEQAIANRKKILRTVVRLKHSIAADNEINDRLDDEITKVEKAIQRGIMLALPDPEKLIDVE